MPHVIVKLWPGKPEEQKQQLAGKIVEAFREVMDIPDKSVSVGFEEIPREDWQKEVYEPDIIKKEASLYKKPGY
jgi:4-oxalocrotonate tautomerase